jgi:raffinose/stachyose/melibiose transport system permease protein/N-acetylglucosamine transport system permease protein
MNSTAIKGITKKKSKENKCSLPKLTLIIVMIIFIIYAITLVFPFIWSAFNSFRMNNDFKRYPTDWFNFSKWSLDNYVIAFSEKYNMFTMFMNSLILAIGGTVSSIIMCSISAYVVSKYNFKGKNFIYGLAITIMLIPTSGSLAAQYKFMYESGLVNHYYGIILMYAGGFGFNFFLLYGFFKSISWSYAEAAQMDGASNLQIFIKVMLPQAKPALFAVGIISFIGFWNDYFTPFMYLRKHSTLAVGIYLLQKEMSSSGSNWPVVFSAMVFSSVPIIIIFAIFQKTIIENTVAGGLKG